MMLEIEQLKYALVLMDQERTVHPMPSLKSALEFVPNSVEIPMSYVHYMDGDRLHKLRNEAISRLVTALVQNSHDASWASVNPLTSALGEPVFRVQMFLGIPRPR